MKRALQHRLGDAVLQVSDDVGHQPVTLRIVHDLAHERTWLSPVVIVLAQRVGGAHELAAGVPDRHFGIACLIGLRAAL